MPSVKTASEEKILEAAKKVFFRQGLKGARMTDIAAEAGITRASLNYYFRSKELLFREVVITGVKEVQEYMINSMENIELTLEAFIPFLVSSIIDTMRRSPELAFFMIMIRLESSPAITEEIAKEIERNKIIVDALKIIVDEEVKKGAMHPIDPHHLTQHIMSLCVFPFLDRQNIMKATGYSEAEMDRFYTERKNLVTDLLLRGLKK